MSPWRDPRLKGQDLSLTAPKTGKRPLLGHQTHHAFRRITAESQPMAEVIRTAIELSELDSPVIIHGPAGTGKGLVARGIHYASRRGQEPFVELDCSSLPEDVLAVELFGDVTRDPEGSTGILTLAGRGTALLRQIHTLTPPLQARLARAMAEGIPARIFVASKASARELLSGGGLITSLAEQLGNATMRIPSLSERDRDVVVIANEVLLDYGLNRREPPKELAPETVDVLLSHSWPGNVRELLHVVTAAAERSGSSVLTPDDLVIRVRRESRSHAGRAIPIPDEGATLEWVVEEAVRLTLEITGGNKSHAARILEISRPTLLKKLRSLEARQQKEEILGNAELMGREPIFLG